MEGCDCVQLNIKCKQTIVSTGYTERYTVVQLKTIKKKNFTYNLAWVQHSSSSVMLFLALGVHFYSWPWPSANCHPDPLEQSPSVRPWMPGRKTCRLHRHRVVRHADNVREQTDIDSVLRKIEKMTRVYRSAERCDSKTFTAFYSFHTLRLVKIVMGTRFTEVLTCGQIFKLGRGLCSVPSDWLFR